MDHEVTSVEHLTLTLKKQYSRAILFGSVSGTEAKSKQPNNALRIAHVGPRKAGRPRKRRIPSALKRSAKRIRLYGFFREKGHDKRTCPHRTVQDTNDDAIDNGEDSEI